MSEDELPGAQRRAALAADITARTGIDEAMIEHLVRAFYEHVRQDPLIGPIFDSRVHDWEVHLQRMFAFWSSVTLMTGRYHGAPMVVHLPLPVGTPHFNRWLELFAQTAHSVCPPAAASYFLERAHRIADSLEMGISARKGEISSRQPRPASTRLPATN